MKLTPAILITPGAQRHGVEFSDSSLSLSDRYPRAIVEAGGVPWVLPCLPSPELVAEAVRRCDGVMLTGGDDIEPSLYGATLSPRLRRTLSALSPARDLVELMLISEVFKQRKPLLAICRGQQLLNVALGGTLVVDIGSQLPNALRHDRSDRKDQLVHDMEIKSGSRLEAIFQRSRVGINSSHHQAVGRVSRMLQVTAASADGVVEGMELAASQAGLLPYLVAVQFHPERLYEKHPEFAELFGSFIRACRPPRRQRT